ncbi:hypothetical protein Ddc_11004 [Ditylenchus destructor]|nr:hypothetical protein Ddc_11004 [Ditylenchus destructor]
MGRKKKESDVMPFDLFDMEKAEEIMSAEQRAFDDKLRELEEMNTEFNKKLNIDPQTDPISKLIEDYKNKFGMRP